MSKKQPKIEEAVVPIEKVVENPENYRGMDEAQFRALKNSLKERGQYKPMQVKPIKDGYMAIGGNHTLRAMKELGFFKVKVNIWRDISDEDAEILSLQDNIQGQDNLLKLGRLVYKLTVERKRSIKDIAFLYGHSEGDLKDALQVAHEEHEKILQKIKEEVSRENFVEIAFVVDEKPKEQIDRFIKEITAFALRKGAEVESIKKKINPKKVTVALMTFNVTAPQAALINQAVEKLIKEEKVSKGRALELICADFLAGA